jgi:hypothetical protein
MASLSHVRVSAVAISVTVLLFLSAGFYPSFGQQMNPPFIVKISPQTINPGDAVSIRIASMLEPNSSREVIVRFFPPQGSAQQYQLHLKADPSGFTTTTILYPNDFTIASTQQPGNYTVFVQDIQPRMLTEYSSFEVVEPEGFQTIPSSIIGPLILAMIPVTGVIATLVYNYLSTKRQIKVALNQKKTESHLTLRHHYLHVVAYMDNIRQSFERLRQEDKENLHINAKLIEEELQWCFYNIIRYLKEDRELFNKAGAYFLDDQRGAALMTGIRDRIQNWLIVALTRRGFSTATRIASQERPSVDFQSMLHGDNQISQLYTQFRTCLIGHLHDQEIDTFILNLRLFSNIHHYEDENLFKDWFPKRKQVKKIVEEELRDNILTDLRNDELWKPVQEKLGYPSISFAERLKKNISIRCSTQEDEKKE